MKHLFFITLAATLLTACNQSQSNQKDLDAFRKVDWSLVRTLQLINNQNKEITTKLDNAYAKDAKAVLVYRNATDSAIAQSDEMVMYIQDLKSNLVKYIDNTKFLDKYDTMLEHIDKRDEREKCSIVLIGDINDGYPQHSTGLANDLKIRLHVYRKNMIALLNSPVGIPRDTITLAIGLLTYNVYVPGEGRKLWEVNMFDDMPLIADIVMLTKLQLDVRNAESAFLNYFYYNIDSHEGCGFPISDTTKHYKSLR
ncbi:MAG TPA: hypothetical protein VK890_01315 [Bacteroidia bacterium]|jgi:hypothetical protein|nr:hypothetical protein [Bacteroidia bacterium]